MMRAFFIVGPTATGKSEIAAGELAGKLSVRTRCVATTNPFRAWRHSDLVAQTVIAYSMAFVRKVQIKKR